MKIKFFRFKSIVTYVTIAAFYMASTLSAVANPLRPISLAQMYSLASQGNVRALRAAVQRGMNIDATDRYGNTGLCHSIYQNNYTAYNAFHASGANPRHPCIQNIPPEQYDYFMSSSRATPVTATPRDAYKEFADGEFVFSTTTWVIGGLLLAGGIAALAFGGGGGGGGGGYVYFPPAEDTFTPTDDSLGALVGTATPSSPATKPYVPVKLTSGTNTQDFTLDNDSQIMVDGEQQNLSDVINFNDSVLEYTPYLQVGMKAIDGKQVVNGEAPLTGAEAGTTITLLNNTIGLAALHNATAINNNTLNILAQNGTIGMVGSDNSLIQNNGNIDISFRGGAATNQVNGMYVETSSSAINNGNITGNVTSENAAGRLIGMQGRLINQVQNPEKEPHIQVNNYKNITLSATAVNDTTLSTSLVGMGSYLENDFISGNKLVRRTGYIDMNNTGQIDINVNLGDSGTYDTSQTNLYDGTGGIIGMRADAHTNAFNNGSIDISIAPESATSVANAHAGMLSVHGGNITNNANIVVDGGIGGYGMLGIRGEGTNSEFNTLNPTLINSKDATIIVNSIDGFGMATRHGGTVTNLGKIVMGENSTGLQINAGTGLNSGTITLNNSGTGMAVKKNTSSEAGTSNNSSTAVLTNNNGAQIVINNANGATGMFLEDGTANNNGTITINGTASTSTESSYGIQAENGTVNNSGTINMDVLLSGDEQAYGIYGGNAASVTNSGSISFSQTGTGTYTTSGTNTNSGTITMSGSSSTGMASDSGTITNTSTGQIILENGGTGAQSNTGQVINQGSISISNGTNSVGINSGSYALNDQKAVISITGANSTGILLGENASATNLGEITLNSGQDSTENYGIKSDGGANTIVTNGGKITLKGYNYDLSKEVGYGISIAEGQAVNNNSITISEMYGYGMSSTSGKLTNNNSITLSNGGYGIQSDSGSVFNNEDGTIVITGTPSLSSSYGIGVETGTAQNYGAIVVSGNNENTNGNVYGIYVNGGNGINNNLINMYANNAYGLYDAAGGVLTNANDATINLFGNDSTAILTSSGKAENFGTINVGVLDENGSLQGGSNSIGMTANEGGTALNSGIINLNSSDATAMYANGGTVQNTIGGEIIVNNSGSTVFKVSNGGEAINNGKITVNADNYELFSSEGEGGGTFTNNGSITADSSASKILVVGDDTSIENTSNIDLDGDNSYIIYTTGSGNATNSGELTLTENSDASYGIYMDETATGTVENSESGIINVDGSNSYGMYIAATDEASEITNNGQILVTGDSSSGMGSSNGATIKNSGFITVTNGTAGIYALGGTVINDVGATIKIAQGTQADGIHVTNNDVEASITNSGNITINDSGNGIYSNTIKATNTITNAGSIDIKGSGNAIEANDANITNNQNASINVTGSGNGILLTNGSVTNAGRISLSGNNFGIKLTGSGSIVNNKDATITLGNQSTGMWISGAGTIQNLGSVLVNGQGTGTYGIRASAGTAQNDNLITINGQSATGMFADGGTITNSASGVVDLNGNQSVGLLVNSGNAYNAGTINFTGQGSIGLQANGGTAANQTELDVDATNAIGMFANGGTVNNDQGATITLTNGSAAMAANAGTANNNGTINITTTNGNGMQTSGSGSANNNSSITVNGQNSNGMFANGGTATNTASGSITVSASGGKGMVSNEGQAINQGKITATEAGTLAMYADGGTITNSQKGILEGSSTSNYLMLAENGGSIFNYGTISFNGQKSAIQATDSSAQNSGTITVNAGYGMTALSKTGTASVTNNSAGIINVSENLGMIAQGAQATATNSGTITVASSALHGMAATDGGTVINQNTISHSGTGFAIYTKTGGEGINNKIINILGSGTGIFVNGEEGQTTATNESNGIITMTGANSIGMSANSAQGFAYNKGTINAQTGSGYAMTANGGNIYNENIINYSGSSSAMSVSSGGSAFNSGTISATTGNGMFADGSVGTGATAINNGTISTNAANSIGMTASSTSVTAKVVNGLNGIINISGNNGVGMSANGSGAQAINQGIININTTSSQAYGMLALNGGSVENAGTINMMSGAQGIGIFVGSGSNFYNNASGKIVFAGGATHTGAITEDPSAGEVTICEEGGACNNKFIYLQLGANLINSGTMVTSTSFNRSSFGEGNVVLTSTAKMIAEDEIADTYSVASDASMLAQGQKDVYVNGQAVQANKISATFSSLSPMWRVSTQDSQAQTSAPDDTQTANTEADSEEKDDNSSNLQIKDIVYQRVGFNQLLSNASQANYLEANYAIRNSIYDGMILASSQEEFNRAVQEGLGLDLFPNFAKQNMDVMRSVNRQINSAVFNNTDEDENRTTVGYDFFGRDQDGYNGLSGYEDEAHSGYALFDHRYNEFFRYGIGASITKYDSEYDNGSERNEVIAQIMTPLLFEAKNTKILSMPKVGMGWGEYTRYAQGKEYKADTRNYYYGINNEVRHDIDMGFVTLEPVAEFNVLGFYQNRTKENIRVESNNNLSLEGGLGLYAKKSFHLSGEDELKLRLGGTYYHEFNNPYQAPKAGIDGLIGHYQMESYDAQKDRAVLSARFDYKSGKFNFYLEGNHYVEDDDTYSINAGLTYAF